MVDDERRTQRGEREVTIKIACDGSCIQPGDFRKGDTTDRPGAAGFVARMPDGSMVGKATHSPNGLIGAMEVQALHMGLQFAARVQEHLPEQRGKQIEIVCDSQYAVNGYNEWLEGWAKRGYHKKGGLANADQWREIDALKQDLGDAVKVVWTKAHTGRQDENSRLNQAVDDLVNAAASDQRSSDTTHLAFPDALSLQSRYRSAGAVPAVSTEDAKRLYDAVADGTLVSAVPETIQKTFGAEPQTRMTTDEFMEKAAALVQKTPEPKAEKPISGIHAQALAMLAEAAANPEMSSLLAAGLELALDKRSLTERYGPKTVDAAQSLQAALQKRGNER